MKKWLVLFIVAALLCPFLGCGKQEDMTIWVVTEQTTWDRMNGQLWVLKESFEASHPGVTIQVDILPIDEQERAAYMQQLRTQIMQGGGPDMYLLPTDDQLIINQDSGYYYPQVEPLFSDVTLAMKNGMFRDISRWYDADTHLGKESLNATIMDAGVVDGRRYVLPLRYDLSVIYADVQALEMVGFDVTTLEKPLSEMLKAAMETGNAYLIAGCAYKSSSVLGNWIDYDSGQVTATEESLASYLENYQKSLEKAKINPAYRISVSSYAFGNYDYHYPLYIGSLADILNYAPFAQYKEAEYAVLPLQAEGGGTVATVTYYTAMGSGCNNPELTYEFMRQFLLEESQWEYNRPTKMNLLVGYPPGKGRQDKTNKTQYSGIIESGWPVRTDGSLAPLWEVFRKQFYTPNTVGETKKRMRKLGLDPLEEHWEEILRVPIHEVRFPSVVDHQLESIFIDLNDYMNEYRATDVSISAISQDLFWDMRRHVSEG